MNEIWKDIKTNKTSQISNLGNVRSNKKIRYFMLSGYRRVQIYNKQYYIHRLVAQAFIPNPENKPCVNHINGNKLDNRVENLEWCTYSENNSHAYKTGLRKPNIKTNKHKSICMLDDDKDIICIFTKMNNVDKVFNKRVSANICRAIKRCQKCEGYYWEKYYSNDLNLKIDRN